ncbi:MAG: DUF1329 domain-containing protein [Candidatus Binataceae bacterium]
MRTTEALIGFFSLVLLAAPIGAPATLAASQAAAPSSSALSLNHTPDTIPVGTVITMQNWQRYKRFMPDGMVALFEGKYFWKMPPDVEIKVGPTIIHPLPNGYRSATERYSSQVRLVHQRGGEADLVGYHGGQPFPNPSGDDKGWEILANLWFRYMPHLSVNTYGAICLQNQYENISCSDVQIVSRQLSYNTDPGIPADAPGTNGEYLTEWVMTVAPENLKYTASLSIAYNDVTKDQDNYVFLPALRRYQPVSAEARCSPSGGSDVTYDDYRFGFNGVIGQFQAAFLGERKILALTGYEMPKTEFPDGFDMPLGWPKPSWGKWQLRDVDVIDVRKIPSMAAGYCYGKRIMYIDKQFNAALWEELYDSKMRLWKITAIFPHTLDAPQIGPVDSNYSQFEAVWNVRDKHATYFIDPADGRAFYLNQQAPKQFNDIAKYSTPSGLNEIMR